MKLDTIRCALLIHSANFLDYPHIVIFVGRSEIIVTCLKRCCQSVVFLFTVRVKEIVEKKKSELSGRWKEMLSSLNYYAMPNT